MWSHIHAIGNRAGAGVVAWAGPGMLETIGARVGHGGARRGSGRRLSGAAKGREWFRSIVDDPKRRLAYIAAVDKQLAEGNPQYFDKAFEAGYGRAPQSLTVSRSLDANDEFVATFHDATTIVDEGEADAQQTTH